MNDPTRSDDAKREPWHAADEKPKDPPKGGRPTGVPIGTHSLTGGGASVGLPSSSPQAKEGTRDKAERSEPRDAPPGAEEPDPLLEPRAGGGDLLGRR